MKTFKIIGILAILTILFSFGKDEAMLALAGGGGVDKYVSNGTEITFNKQIIGFAVAGSTDIVITSIKDQNGDEVVGLYNYLDEGITLKPGENYAFRTYTTKMTLTNGGEILVNYRK